MEIPTYIDHNNGVREDPLDRRPYLERYAEARGLDTPTKTYLAHLAFKQVEAEFRLVDVSQSVRPVDDNRTQAYADEVAGWQAKAARFLVDYPGLYLFMNMLDDFRTMAAFARVMDEDERQFSSMCAAGLAGQVEVELLAPEPYAWQNPANAFDSAFADS